MVVARAKVPRDVARGRGQGIQRGEGREVAIRTEGGERRRSAAADVGAVDLASVGLPIVGDDAVAERLRQSRDDPASGKDVDEGSRGATGSIDGFLKERQQLPLVPEIGNELMEEIVVGLRRRVLTSAPGERKIGLQPFRSG
jgi:hypothetical protein